MSEPDGDPLEELRGDLSDLRAALDEIRTATSPRQREEAEDELEEVEESVAQAAKRAGVSPSVFNRAIREAKQAQFREENAPMIKQILNELLEEAKGKQDEPDDEPEPGPKPKPKPKPVEPPPPDTAPNGTATEHWSERAVGELIR